MADEKKPSLFEELIRRMGWTKQFPIDLQPINPAAPMTDREAQKRVSAFVARLREAAKGTEKSATPLSQPFKPAEMGHALAEETGLSEEDLKQPAPGLLDGERTE